MNSTESYTESPTTVTTQTSTTEPQTTSEPYSSSSDAYNATTTTTGPTDSGFKLWLLGPILGGVVVLAIVILIVIYFCRSKRKPSSHDSAPKSGPVGLNTWDDNENAVPNRDEPTTTDPPKTYKPPVLKPPIKEHEQTTSPEEIHNTNPLYVNSNDALDSLAQPADKTYVNLKPKVPSVPKMSKEDKQGVGVPPIPTLPPSDDPALPSYTPDDEPIVYVNTPKVGNKFPKKSETIPMTSRPELRPPLSPSGEQAERTSLDGLPSFDAPLPPDMIPRHEFHAAVSAPVQQQGKSKVDYANQRAMEWQQQQQQSGGDDTHLYQDMTGRRH